MVKRFSIWLINLDPTVGSEIAKKRPCVVISPDVTNAALKTVIVAPLTSTQKPYPTRVNTHLNGQDGQVALDQIRTVDKVRLVRELDRLDETTSREVCAVLQSLFAF